MSGVARVAGLAVAAALTLAPQLARAYPTGSQFDDDPMIRDGGGGILFSGSPRWSGHTCAVCHTAAPGLIGVDLQTRTSQADLFSTGYAPGTSYQLRVVLTDEWAGLDLRGGDSCGGATNPYVACNDNGFALEIDDQNGKPVGKFRTLVPGAGCVDSPQPSDDFDVRVTADGKGITHLGRHHGRASWDLCWSAPRAGTGPVTAYVAAVDGNGGDHTKANPNDRTGDDVFAAALPIDERGGAPLPTDTGGCASGGEAGLGAALGLAVLALVLGRPRRRWLLVLALLAGGCVTVKPYQREHLAKRIMKFAPDPSEDELDLHMLEAREGSAGGYGSAGGGCGCN